MKSNIRPTFQTKSYNARLCFRCRKLAGGDRRGISAKSLLRILRPEGELGMQALIEIWPGEGSALVNAWAAAWGTGAAHTAERMAALAAVTLAASAVRHGRGSPTLREQSG